MQRIYAITLVLIIFISCNKETEPRKNELSGVISSIVTKNGKTYLEVGNVPFPIFGAQIRLDALMNCDKLTLDEIEPYFAKAKELDLNCVQIPIWWKCLEPAENNYSFEVINTVLEYANLYDLKIEIIWFSTNMCGDSFSYLIPNYILAAPGKRFARWDDGRFWNYYGYQYSLILDDEWILERESLAIKQLINFISLWDSKNGNSHPVITINVHNEPDAFARWRFDQKNIRYTDGSSFSKEDAWKMTLNALNAVGKAAKDSTYMLATRANIITKNGIADFPEVTGANPLDVFELEGIDFISYDPYVRSVLSIKTNTLAFKSIEGNYPLIAENKGAYDNSASLILAAAALGSGYNIYDLATSKFFIDNTSPDMVNEIDHGIYTWDLKEKSYTQKVRSVLKGLKLAFPDVAKTNAEDFIAFNVRTQYPNVKYTQTVNSTKLKFSFSTAKGALAFAITAPGYLLIYSTEESTFEISNGTFSDAQTGAFNKNGVFEISESNILLQEGFILTAEKEKLYKISYTSNGELNSTAIENIGY